MITKITISGLLLILVFITGIWMSKLGKPYQTALFTVHKLATLAIIVLAVIIIRTVHNQFGLTSTQWILAIGTSVVLLVAIATGGILSAKEETIKTVQILHRILPALTLIGVIALFISVLKNL